MIILDNTIISEEIKDVCFCCDLEKCKGACCVEGDAGAPLEEEEISILEDTIDIIMEYMRPEGIAEIERTGVFDYDADARFVTPLVNGRECAYVYFENGIALCAIEKAYQLKKIDFQKPLSCHLYPVRLSKLKNYDAVNYHKWHVCRKALDKGSHLVLPLYKFLEEPLQRKYSRTWYNRLVRLILEH